MVHQFRAGLLMVPRAGCLVLRRVAGAVLPAGPRVVLALVCLLGLATGRASGEVIDRVLAVVSGSLITLSDVNAAADLGLVVPSASGDRVREVLSRLIDRELEMAEVARYAPPEPTAAQVELEVQKVHARFASPDAFAVVLAKSGMDLAHLRETLREDLRIRTYLEQRFTGSGEQRPHVIAEWVAGLRRRADIVDLLLTDHAD